MLDKLSYSVKKKSEKLIELKDELDNLKINAWLIGLMIISAFYMLSSITRYSSYLQINYILQAFLTIEGSNISAFTKVIDFIFLAIFIITTFKIYKTSDLINKKESNFQSLRKNFINELNTNLCLCNNKCNCDDELIKYMQKKNIDLIFK